MWGSVSILQADHFRARAPPYASTVMVEYYDDGTNPPYVRFIYKNESALYNATHDGHVLTIRGCQQSCPLDKLKSLTADIVPSDWAAVRGKIGKAGEWRCVGYAGG